MQQTKIIKVFLASSITELKDERIDLSIIGDDISNLFSQDNIAVRFVKCENLHTGNIGEDDQSAIDQKLRECELSLFLFKAKAGEWTIHEFEIARALQKETLHRMFVYFIRTPDETKKEDNLVTFQQRLKKENIFWKECDNLLEIKFSFAMGILTHLGITISEGTPESKAITQDGDARFAKYKKDKQHLAQLQKDIHNDIDDLWVQIKNLMTDNSQLIIARVIRALELYHKADCWAAATAYDKEKYSYLLSDYTLFLYKYGMFWDAELVSLRLILITVELYGTEHENTAISYNNLGLVYWKQGDYSKALEYSFKALAIRKKIFGTEHPDTATSYNNIGALYDDQGDYSKALGYYFKALPIVEKNFGAEHPNTASSYNNIGMLYFKQGNYDKAMEYNQKALAIRKKVFGIEHPDTACSYNNIGALYNSQGNYGKAMECYQKALAILEKGLGKEHPDTATSYNNIGDVYREQGDYGKALEYHQQALVIRERILGMEHPETALSYWHISTAYYYQNDYKKALVYLNKAYLIYEKTLGLKHPYLRRLLEWIVVVKEAMNSNGETK